MSAALIVQNKGGGHGELGYQLAKTLSSHPKISSITILQDDACDDAKEPFKSYPTEFSDGVKVVKAPLGDESMTSKDLQSILGDGTAFEYVWDNASKAPEGSGKAVCECCRTWGVKLLTYVSSAGMYVPDDETEFPMAETTPIKDAGQARYDAYAAELGLPLVSFRPQYIYGPKSNKHDYIDWYFDRIVRGEKLLIPGDGEQKVSLTNSEDVAELLASPLNDEAAAVEQRFFNCGTDKLYSYDDVARMCLEAAVAGGADGVDGISIEHYDGKRLGKGSFPFRVTDFYVAPDAAKSKLGYGGAKHDLPGDLGPYFESYKARGGLEREVDFSKDAEIIGQLADVA